MNLSTMINTARRAPTALPALASQQWYQRVIHAQTALFERHAPGLTHTALTLAHKNGTINGVESTNAASTSETVLLLLHGWGAGLGMYTKALAHLPYRTVYTLDLPGMGGSTREAFPEEYGAGVGYFVDALDEAFGQLAGRAGFRGRRVLAGHSLGGFLAAEWQLRRPRFDALLLVSPVGVPRRPAPARDNPGFFFRLARRLWTCGVTPQAVVRLLGRAPVRGFVNARFDLGEEDAALVAEYLYAVSAAPPAGERAINVLLAPGAWARDPLIGRLGPLQMPVAFLYGEKDWMDWTAGERARSDIEWSRLARVADAGHHVFVDAPAEFAKQLAAVVAEMESEFWESSPEKSSDTAVDHPNIS